MKKRALVGRFGGTARVDPKCLLARCAACGEWQAGLLGSCFQDEAELARVREWREKQTERGLEIVEWKSGRIPPMNPCRCEVTG